MSDVLHPLPVSLVVIAHNEEDRIGRCLASAADLVAEVVVLVNDCTDRTVEIATSFGAHVVTDSWHGHRDQKNLALDHATQPWVLALDCDEELTEPLRDSLVAFFANGDADRYDGARFARRVWFLDRWILHGDFYPDWSLRLFRNGVRWVGSSAHDKIVVDGPVATLAGDCNHYSCPDMSSQVAKINVFADAFVRDREGTAARWSLVNTLFRPLWRFVRAYVLRRGFLDGYPGFHIAVVNAFGTFVRHARLYERDHGSPPANEEAADRPGDRREAA